MKLGRISRGLGPLPPLVLLIPGIIAGLAMALPVVYLFIRSYGVGDAFWTLLLRDRTLQILQNTILLAGGVTISAIVIAIPLAWLTVRTDLPLARLMTILTVLPLSIPTLVGGFTFVAAFGYGGIFHQFMNNAGLTYMPRIYGYWGAWLVLTFLSYPYVLLSVRSALKGLDASQEEAARGLGLKPWQIFFQLTLPQLKPSIGAGGLLVALYTLSDFAAVSMLQYETFTRAIHVQYVASFNRSYAAVLSLVLVFLTGFVLWAESRFRGRALYARVGSGTGRMIQSVSLGRWRWPAFIFCLLVISISFLLPLGVSLFWLIRGIINGESLLFQWVTLFNSFYVSVLAAAATVLAALPVAILAVRYPRGLTKALEKLAYAGYALPGIVIALSLVFFTANYLRPIYQTLPVLVFAYAVLFLPQALGALRSSLLQLGPNIENAGLSLGVSMTQVVWQVTLPIIKPGIFAGAALVFLTTIKELPATLILSPIGFATLTTQIWSSFNEAFYARAAAPSILLMLVSSLSIWILFSQEGRGR